MQSAEVNFGGKTAVVNFDENVVQQKTLLKKLQDIGYNATEGDQQQRQLPELREAAARGGVVERVSRGAAVINDRHARPRGCGGFCAW